jgi:uncharacterized membrane-anchored protein
MCVFLNLKHTKTELLFNPTSRRDRMLKLKSSIKEYGPVFYGNKTKELLHRIPFACFALLDHEDIDQMAALSLIQKKVRGVLNYSPSMTGQYPSLGTTKLIESNIPVYDVDQPEKLKAILKQGDVITIEGDELWVQKQNDILFVTTLTRYTPCYIREKNQIAKTNLTESLRAFTHNTLSFAQEEMDEILKPILLPPLKMKCQNRHVVVVTRGSGYKEDLRAIKGYIKEKNPILIGVDGGADAILECGHKPDLILGDMDSVSLAALKSGAEIVVHAYADGKAPGFDLLKKHQIKAHLFPCFGTSEDAAHLLAFEAGAALIVTLGSHTNMVDFLEKGRKGMGSTLLVRLKIGEKLVDAKGVRLLYAEKS